MKIRKPAEINAGSMADIAFLLLLFFLIATTISVDTGITRKLPPPITIDNPPPIPDRNILTVLINKNDNLLVEGKSISLKDLRKEVKHFIANPNNDDDLPKLYDMEIKFLGTLQTTKNHVISLQNDRGTSYNMYLTVQNELTAAYNELRDELALQHFNKKFDDLKEEKQIAIKKVYPNHISEAIPRNVNSELAELQ